MILINMKIVNYEIKYRKPSNNAPGKSAWICTNLRS